MITVPLNYKRHFAGGTLDYVRNLRDFGAQKRDRAEFLGKAKPRKNRRENRPRRDAARLAARLLMEK
jgi:hypothetical protein